MFRVDYRYSGQGLWNSPSLPVTLQAAIGQARARTGSLVADEARVVPSAGAEIAVAPHMVDLLV